MPVQSSYRQELELLYSRRCSIDALIESLEDYDRFREKRVTQGERESA